MIDEVYLYGNSLSTKQIKKLYENQLPLPHVNIQPRVLPSGPSVIG